jgi:hypothetical protein
VFSYYEKNGVVSLILVFFFNVAMSKGQREYWAEMFILVLIKQESKNIKKDIG